MEATPSDPVIDEVRAARQQISERVGHDSARLVAYYLEFQERYRGRLVRARPADEPTSAAGRTIDHGGPAARAADSGR